MTQYTYKDHINPMREILVERFPRAFVPRGNFPKHPLSVGIREDILAECPDLDGEVLNLTLAAYVTKKSYLEACTHVGRTRVNLRGEAKGRIQEKDVMHANGILKWKKKKEERAKTRLYATRVELIPDEVVPGEAEVEAHPS